LPAIIWFKMNQNTLIFIENAYLHQIYSNDSFLNLS